MRCQWFWQCLSCLEATIPLDEAYREERSLWFGVYYGNSATSSERGVWMIILTNVGFVAMATILPQQCGCHQLSAAQNGWLKSGG